MNLNEFVQHIEAAKHRTGQLNAEIDSSPTYQELLLALEELNVAEEELRRQNESLAVARSVLEEERQRYRELFQYAPDAYLVTDVHGKIYEVNQAAERLFNLPVNFLLGKLLTVFVPINDRPEFRSKLRQLYNGDWVQEWETRLQPREVGEIHAALTVSVVRDAEKAPVTLRWLIRDITARKQSEAKTSLVRDRILSQAVRALHTPATTLKMALDRFEHTTTDEQRSRYLKLMHSACNQQMKFTDDFLALQALETKTYKPVLLEVLNVPDLVSRIADRIEPKIRSRQQSLQLQVSEAVPALKSDRRSLKRIVRELLDNAHQFTPERGTIVFSVQAMPQHDGIQLVCSNSSEIAVETLPQIFETFYAAPTLESRYEGMGLGLAIVKQLVDYLNGSIEVTSRDGWTTFQVQLMNQP